ncbi:MAG: hypothetical protein ACNI27_05520 [Desulfovibrio sp.]
MFLGFSSQSLAATFETKATDKNPSKKRIVNTPDSHNLFNWPEGITAQQKKYLSKLFSIAIPLKDRLQFEQQGELGRWSPFREIIDASEYTLEQPKTQFTNTSRIDTETEMLLGFHSGMALLYKMGGPSRALDVQYYINRIVSVLAPHSLRPDMPYDAILIKNANPFFYTTPGGDTYISEGIIRKLKNEAQLAALVAMGISATNQRMALLGVDGAHMMRDFDPISEYKTTQPLFAGFLKMLLKSVISNGNGLVDFEALDKNALIMMYKEGYNPVGYVSLLNILQNLKLADGTYSKNHRASFKERSRKAVIFISKIKDWRKMPRIAKRYKQYTFTLK